MRRHRHIESLLRSLIVFVAGSFALGCGSSAPRATETASAAGPAAEPWWAHIQPNRRRLPPLSRTLTPWAQRVAMPDGYEIVSVEDQSVFVRATRGEGFMTMRLRPQQPFVIERGCVHMAPVVAGHAHALHKRFYGDRFEGFRIVSEPRLVGSTCEGDLAVDWSHRDSSRGLWFIDPTFGGFCISMSSDDCYAVVDAIARGLPPASGTFLGRAAR